MISRRQVARYLAGRPLASRKHDLLLAAAWLIDRKRQRQTSYLADDIAADLTEQGYVYTRVISAEPLTDAGRQKIRDFLQRRTGASQIEFEEVIDRSVIGGIRLELPGSELDGTVKSALQALVEEAYAN